MAAQARHEPGSNGSRKDFRLWRFNNGTWRPSNGKSTPLPPYLLPEVRNALLASPDRIVFVVEGEKTCLALHDSGNVTTCGFGGAAGAGQWPRLAKELKHAGVRRAVVWPDADAAGTKLGVVVNSELGAAGIQCALLDPEVVFGLRKGSKHDAFDWIEQGGDPALLSGIGEAALTQAHETTKRTVGPIIRRLSEVEPQEVQWLWQDLIPLRGLTILAGEGGCGKSTLALDLASRISIGAQSPCGRSVLEPGDTLLCDSENDPETVLSPISLASGADGSRISLFDGYVHNEDGPVTGFSLENIGMLREALKRLTRPRLVILDALNSFMGRANANSDLEVRQRLDVLQCVSREFDLAVLCLCHLNKNQLGTARERILGSVGYVNTARSVLLVAKGKACDEADVTTAGSLNTLVVGKSNYVSEGQGIRFRVENRRVLWDNSFSRFDVEKLFARKTGESRQIEVAKQFLLDALKHGPVESKIVAHCAEQSGISDATLRRARSDLRIVPRRQGALGQSGAWVLELPNRKAS